MQFPLMISRLLSLMTALLLSGLTSCSSTPQDKQLQPMPARESAWCAELLRELNDYRQQRGLAPLENHSGLTRISLSHCDWLIKSRGTSFHHGKNVSHSGSDWRRRTARSTHHMEAWGENVAYTRDTPKEVAQHLLLMWKSSPTHHRILLRNWTHSGMALRVGDDGAIFATQTFGRLVEDTSTP